MDTSLTDRNRELLVDEADPFYFDHPLDHVPGMLLFGGVLAAAARAEAARAPERRPGRVTARLAFTRFCELDQATALSCEPGGDHAWTVAARQDGMDVCTGDIGFPADTRFSGGAPPGCPPGPVDERPGVPLGRPPGGPAAAGLVHRQRPENILVGEPVRRGRDLVECAVLDLPEGNALRGPGRWDTAAPGLRAPVELVEAGRQFATMMMHWEYGRPMDVTLLWLALRLDLPGEVARAVPLVLRWPVARFRGRRSRFALTLVDASGGAVLGSLSYDAHPAGAKLYARMRSA